MISTVWIRYTLIFTFVLTLMTIDSGAQSSITARTISDIRYDQQPDVNPNLLSVDVYTSDAAVNWPVMVYVHGGGWSGGDKGNVSFKPEFFVSEGYVFVSVNYRLTPQVDFPVHAQDVAHAIASAMDNIGQFGGDANQLYLMGHSAGAHLVTLVATDEGYLAEHGKSLSDLRGVISNDIRAYDMVDLAARSGGVLPSSYQPVFGEDPEFWAMASPISHVASDKGIPPMMILYSGTGNDSGRAYFANNFADALNVAGVKTRVVGSLGQTHSEINREIGTPNDQVTAAIMRFLDDISDT